MRTRGRDSDPNGHSSLVVRCGVRTNPHLAQWKWVGPAEEATVAWRRGKGPRVSIVTRRWPLRASLAVALVGLVGVDAHYAVPRARAATNATTTSAPSPTTSTPSGATSTSTPPTTLAPRAAGAPHVAAPIIDPATIALPTRCHLAMTVTTTTTTTTAAPTSTTSAPGAASTRAASAHPGRCVVLEVGDSLGNDLGWGLARELAPTAGLTLVQRDLSSSGLVTTWFYDWPTQLRAALARYHPDLTIVMLGGNDEQGVKVNGRTLGFATPAWDQVYRQRIAQMVRTATAAGSYVAWIGLPVMRPDGYRQGAFRLNTLYQSVAGHLPGSAFIPTWGLFADGQGRFAQAAPVGGVPTVLRSPDGIHFSLAGEDVIATYVARQLGAIFHVSVPLTAPLVISR
jgi:hypothetical protein